MKFPHKLFYMLSASPEIISVYWSVSFLNTGILKHLTAENFTLSFIYDFK